MTEQVQVRPADKRLSQLVELHAFLEGMVPGGAEPNSAGFVQFAPPLPPKTMVAKSFGLTDSAAQSLLNELRDRGLYETSKGRHPTRVLLVGPKAVEALYKASPPSGNGVETPPAASGGNDGDSSPSAPEATDGVEVSPEEIEALLMQALTKLDEYGQTIEEIQTELEAANEELERLRNATAKQVFVLPKELSGLVKHLGGE
jgi:hypothetical protein